MKATNLGFTTTPSSVFVLADVNGVIRLRQCLPVNIPSSGSASAAQATADTALTNAATAQGTANTAATDAATALAAANAAQSTANASLPLAGGTMSGAIAMGNFKVTGLGAPSAAGDAARKTDSDAALSAGNAAQTTANAALPKAGGTMSGAIAMGTSKITGLGAPSASDDAARKADVDAARIFRLTIACSDEATALTTGTAKVTFRMPCAVTLTAVRASLTTTSSSGIPTIDINEAGATILSTKLTIDVGEKTSTTAAVPPVISDAALADDSEITVDIDVAGTGATGLKITLIGTF